MATKWEWFEWNDFQLVVWNVLTSHTHTDMVLKHTGKSFASFMRFWQVIIACRVKNDIIFKVHEGFVNFNLHPLKRRLLCGYKTHCLVLAYKNQTQNYTSIIWLYSVTVWEGKCTRFSCWRCASPAKVCTPLYSLDWFVCKWKFTAFACNGSWFNLQ